MGIHYVNGLLVGDGEIDALERFEARRIGLEEIFDLDDRLHGTLPWRPLRLQQRQAC